MPVIVLHAYMIIMLFYYSPSIGYVPHPVGWIPNLKKVIGMIGRFPSAGGGSFIVVESDRDKHKEVSFVS